MRHLLGSGGEFAVDLPGQRIGGLAVDDQRADARLGVADVDSDELTHCCRGP